MFQYEPSLTIDKEIRPDFVIVDQKGNLIIIEHFGMSDSDYQKKRTEKESRYLKLCKENSGIHFVWTDEEDIYNLKDKLGEKLNETPLKKPMWR